MYCRHSWISWTGVRDWSIIAGTNRRLWQQIRSLEVGANIARPGGENKILSQILKSLGASSIDLKCLALQRGFGQLVRCADKERFGLACQCLWYRPEQGMRLQHYMTWSMPPRLSRIAFTVLQLEIQKLGRWKRSLLALAAPAFACSHLLNRIARSAVSC